MLLSLTVLVQKCLLFTPVLANCPVHIALLDLATLKHHAACLYGNCLRIPVISVFHTRHLRPRFRVNLPIHFFPLYAFMVCTGLNFPS